VRLLADGPWIPIELASRWRRAADALVHACTKAFDDWKRSGGETLRLHGDCHLGNLLWGADGPLLVDFDDFLEGPAVQDLWLLAPGHDEDALRRREIAVAAYSSLRAFDRRALALVEPLRALRILRYAAWIAHRYRDAAFQRAFPEFLEHRFWERECDALEQQLGRL
jgi:Ser/Thr protein kinase RdoA (MazF antagonist)